MHKNTTKRNHHQNNLVSPKNTKEMEQTDKMEQRQQEGKK